MHYYQHNIGDYARDTGHLSVIEHGVYRLLLDWCYLNEKPITTEQAMRLARGYQMETQSVLSEFFMLESDGWTHKRVTKEIEDYRVKAEKNRQNGAKGGRPKPSNNPAGYQTDAKHNPNQEPITKNQCIDMAKTGDSALSPSSQPADANSVQTSQPKDECPHRDIIAVFHEVLPSVRHVRDWTPARAQLLRARWREDSKRQNLDWWRKFFGYVGQSGFLMGRTHSQGRKPFELGLEWLLKAENFAKVREGAYHEAEVAA